MNKHEQREQRSSDTENQAGAGGTRQELTVHTKHHGLEQGSLPEQQNWFGEGLSHEELVRGLRGFIQERGTQLGGVYTPEEIIRAKLQSESETRPFTDEAMNIKRTQFFFQIRSAWDALAYDRYEPGTLAENLAGSTLSMYYQATREPSIQLSDPTQVRMIDAMTEAAGIPHEKGQTIIQIPEKLRSYAKLVLSKGYQERVAKAKSRQQADKGVV